MWNPWNQKNSEIFGETGMFADCDLKDLPSESVRRWIRDLEEGARGKISFPC